MLNRIVEILNVPIMFLNGLGGVVGGIWLAILGEWKLIGISFLLLFISPWIISIALMLNFPILGLTAYFFEKKNPLGYLFSFISQLYINLLIATTCYIAFFWCSSFYAKEYIGFSYIPYLLWSWGMALTPWQYLASKEDNEFSVITLFSTSVFYFLFLTSIFISPLLTIIIIMLFVVVQLIVLPLFNMYIAHQMESRAF